VALIEIFGKFVLTILLYVKKGADFKNVTLICLANDKIDVLAIFRICAHGDNFYPL
jgi:hypothetical protein